MILQSHHLVYSDMKVSDDFITILCIVTATLYEVPCNSGYATQATIRISSLSTLLPITQVTKRDEDSSLMQLKEEFRTYEALRREHDSQIVQIAMEGGLRIAPDQWSSLLYGDQSHKSHMQSIIDKVLYGFWSVVGDVLVKGCVLSIGVHLNVFSHFFGFVHIVVADTCVVCAECAGADDSSAEDRRPCQPEPAQTSFRAAGQHRSQSRYTLLKYR